MVAVPCVSRKVQNRTESDRPDSGGGQAARSPRAGPRDWKISKAGPCHTLSLAKLIFSWLLPCYVILDDFCVANWTAPEPLKRCMPQKRRWRGYLILQQNYSTAEVSLEWKEQKPLLRLMKLGAHLFLYCRGLVQLGKDRLVTLAIRFQCWRKAGPRAGLN